MDDAQSFADWGVDYLKYDNCYHMGRFGTPLISFERFNKMAEALKATGKNIFYSLCNWGEDYSYSVSFKRALQDVYKISQADTQYHYIVGCVYQQLVARVR
jgi:hypothetical protein